MKGIRDEKGFTLIEIIVVIIILGILSVIAIPKYLDLRADAEKGVAKGVTAALRGQIAISHARYLMDNTQVYDATTIADIETDGVTMSSGAGTIEAEFESLNTYEWTYTARNGTTPARVTPNW